MSAETRHLLLLRHGRTAWNHAGRVQGQLDTDLDEAGHAQAALAAPVVAALGPAALWSSDLLRARRTASYVAEATGLPVTHDPRLREFALGMRQGLTHAEYAAVAPTEFAGFRAGDFDVVPDGERTHAVGARMVAALEELAGAVAPGQTAVAVSHGAAIRVAVAALLGWPAAALHSLRGLDNCGWAVVESAGAGTARLAAYNRGARA